MKLRSLLSPINKAFQGSRYILYWEVSRFHYHLSKKGFSYRSSAAAPPIKTGNIKSSSQNPSKDLDIIS